MHCRPTVGENEVMHVVKFNNKVDELHWYTSYRNGYFVLNLKILPKSITSCEYAASAYLSNGNESINPALDISAFPFTSCAESPHIYHAVHMPVACNAHMRVLCCLYLTQTCLGGLTHDPWVYHPCHIEHSLQTRKYLPSDTKSTMTMTMTMKIILLSCNTCGVHSYSMTLTGYIQQSVMEVWKE